MLEKCSLILLRGLPGSGKTTLAKLLSEQETYPVYSVDDYFTDSTTGTYHFDFRKNHLAYKQCEERVKEAMQHGTSKVIVHNTFTIAWELEAYFKLAEEFNYQLFVVTVENYHQHKNSHGITHEQLQKMAEKYKVKLF
ncbi:MAG: ATP-binding protein [Bacteroidetes bacterium]|nr:ATP-binding protein [Bacteroidota bacterium]